MGDGVIFSLFLFLFCSLGMGMAFVILGKGGWTVVSCSRRSKTDESCSIRQCCLGENATGNAGDRKGEAEAHQKQVMYRKDNGIQR